MLFGAAGGAPRSALHFTRCNLNPTMVRGGSHQAAGNQELASLGLGLGSSAIIEEAGQLAQRVEVSDPPLRDANIRLVKG